MLRREFLKTAGTAIAALLVCLSLAVDVTLGAGKRQPTRWNVLFFMSDQHNPHYMGCDHQNPQNALTPNMDRLSQDGMIFDKCYATYPVCAPTRASLATGAYPQNHRHYGNSTFLTEAGPDGATPSIAHTFRENGYCTALLGKTHSNMQSWDSYPGKKFEGKELFMGFDYRVEHCCASHHKDSSPAIPSSEYIRKRKLEFQKRYPEAFRGQAKEAWEETVFAKGNAQEGKLKRFKSWAMPHPGLHHDGVFAFEGIDYLDAYSEQKTDKFGLKANFPFFLMISVVQPHWPYSSPTMQDGTEFYGMYSGRPEDDNDTFLHQGNRRKKLVPTPLHPEQNDPLAGYPASYKGNKKTTPADAIRLARARYSSAVTWVDHLLGKVMAKLDTTPDPLNPGMTLSETTIVVYNSDHGDMMGQHHRTGKMVMYEGSARIPFIIRMPGVISPGQRSNVLLNHNDMFPTLAGLCGLGSQLRKNRDGRDLSAAFAANDPSKGYKRVFSISGLTARQNQHPAFAMARTQKYKFIRFRPRDGESKYALFNMDTDALETKDISKDPQYRNIVKTENEAINAFLAQWEVPAVEL